MSAPKPVVLCILDGWGLREEREANAPAQADTPTFDRIMATCPNATLITHGPEYRTAMIGHPFKVDHLRAGRGNAPQALALARKQLQAEFFLENFDIDAVIALELPEPMYGPPAQSIITATVLVALFAAGSEVFQHLVKVRPPDFL